MIEGRAAPAARAVVLQRWAQEHLGNVEPVLRSHGFDIEVIEVAVTAAGRASPVRHLIGVPVAEWHGDMFDLPAGVTRLASSDAYENGPYGTGDWLLAVQSHPELTDEMHERWLASDSGYLDYADRRCEGCGQRSRKKSVSRAALSSARTPASTSTRWFSRRSRSTS